MILINDDAVAVLQNLHNVAGKQSHPLPVFLYQAIGHSGQNPVMEHVISLLQLLRVLALLVKPFVKGLNGLQVPGAGITVRLVLEDAVPEVRRMVIRIGASSQVGDIPAIRFEVVELQGVLDLTTVAMKLLTVPIESSLLAGCVDPVLLSTAFGLVPTAG